jgi:hypothetical protein
MTIAAAPPRKEGGRDKGGSQAASWDPGLAPSCTPWEGNPRRGSEKGVPTAVEPKKGRKLVEREHKPSCVEGCQFQILVSVENCRIIMKVTMKVSAAECVGRLSRWF